MKNHLNLKQFIINVLITSIWVNISEVFRYFVFVMPSLKSFLFDRSDVAQIDLKIFTIWGFWDTLLTAIMVFFFWLYIQSFGNSLKSVFISGSLVWLAVFVIFWVATANMGLSDWDMLLITLPLSWIEMIVGTWISSKLYKKTIH